MRYKTHAKMATTTALVPETFGYITFLLAAVIIDVQPEAFHNGCTEVFQNRCPRGEWRVASGIRKSSTRGEMRLTSLSLES
ncbi:hypothetical protein E2C01_013592 [Portunus trituberculatus]|uniref:Uncharacterized protein n=1 Tax=Portunus trituberculatus TaxID=210409 RepID=A0A5B7DH20_PORTR|nr:hypothetical protein [Portunus trituberculatus]